MKKKLRLILVLLLLIPVVLAASPETALTIKGVQGKLLRNIKARLKEIAENKSLNEASNEELGYEVGQAIAPYGYFKPKVNINRQSKQLVIAVQSGPPMRVQNIHIQLEGEGQKDATIDEARQEFKIKNGQIFNSKKYEKAKQLLLNAAESRGYLHATFTQAEVFINQEKNFATITLVFNTGPQYYFGQVQFDPTYISPELLKRFIPFQQGQAYSTEQLLAFNSALASSGYFSNVIIKPNLETHEQTIPINVHLQRAHRVNYSVGLGFGTDTGVRGRLGYHVVPVNRAGHKFNVIALGSFKENRLQSQYIIPGKNPLTDQYDLFSSVSSLNYGAGYSNSGLLSFAKRHNLSNYQQVLSINSLYERFNYDNTPKYESFTLYPKANLNWLYHSNPLFTPTGYNISFNLLGASKAFLSGINFMQTSVDAKAALTINKIRTRFYVHGIQGFTLIDDINRLPLSLSLLLGGADNLKAYSFNSIGPGKILTYGGFEIQKETYKHWYLTGFVDTGDVYQPSRKSWQNDIGLGLMWVSPVGPIKIGVAQGIDSNFNHFERKPRLVISMGPDL